MNNQINFVLAVCLISKNPNSGLVRFLLELRKFTSFLNFERSKRKKFTERERLAKKNINKKQKSQSNLKCSNCDESSS